MYVCWAVRMLEGCCESATDGAYEMYVRISVFFNLQNYQPNRSYREKGERIKREVRKGEKEEKDRIKD